MKAFHHRALARHALLKREEGIEDLNVCSNTALLTNKFCCIDLSTKNKELAALTCVILLIAHFLGIPQRLLYFLEILSGMNSDSLGNESFKN